MKKIFINPGQVFNCPHCKHVVITCLHHRGGPVYFGDNWETVSSKCDLKTSTGGKWHELIIPYDNEESKCSNCYEKIFEGFTSYPKMDLPDELFEL